MGKQDTWKQLTQTIVQFEKNPTQLRLEALEWTSGDQTGKAAYNILLGIVRNYSLLKHAIGCFVQRKPKTVLHAYLLIGAYQLLESLSETERRPKIVHHTVSLVKANCSQRESKFANAILRKVSDNLPSIIEELEKQRNWSTRYSHPQWLVSRWVEQIGEQETIDLLKWNQTIPSIYVHDFSGYLRTNETLATELGLIESKWNDFFLFDRHKGIPIKTILEHPLYIQDPATSISPAISDKPIQGDVLDACAAPGGKSIVLQKLLGENEGVIYATDINQKRVGIIKENIERLQLTKLKTFEQNWESDDALHSELPESFDLALVDAPCSSTGIIQKHPEIRWRLKKSDFTELPKLQLNILRKVSAHVKPGGQLIYSTCSIDPIENTSVGEAFLSTEEGKDFVLLKEKYCLPHENEHDGAGIILFQRKSE